MFSLTDRTVSVYGRLKETTDEDEETGQLPDLSILQKARWSYLASPVPWIILTFGFASLSTLMAVRGWGRSNVCPPNTDTYETGFRTEMTMADRPQIEVVQMKFSGTPKFHPNGTAYQDVIDPENKYTGNPSPDIDEAWDELIGERYFYVTQQEAHSLFGDKYRQFELDLSQYIVG
ncbi:hypothetical protein H2200_012602 [Cladophialophora chaetospira]|uniref:Uncharacterized protein n=1 Tax=Cladophialophora chaetospira TaxID=386627 RepID=A0AA38WXC7_9EURO|nr:hypothetical protein H2200_012602 [Cladophialophora chaetospira]